MRLSLLTPLLACFTELVAALPHVKPGHELHPVKVHQLEDIIGSGGEEASFSEVCTPIDFRAAVQKISPNLPGAVDQVGGEDLLVSAYATLYNEYKDVKCYGLPPSAKSPGLVINAGVGTSGTTFPDCVLDNASTLVSLHNPRIQAPDLWPSHYYETATEVVDANDYISDSPIAAMLAHLLHSHQGGTMAGTFITLRDPRDWLSKRRIHDDDHDRDTSIIPQAPCGMDKSNDTLLEFMWTTPPSEDGEGGEVETEEESKQRFSRAQMFMIYQTWAVCLATHPAMGFSDANLAMINLFEMEENVNRDKFYQKMSAWRPESMSDVDTFNAAWANCGHKETGHNNDD